MFIALALTGIPGHCAIECAHLIMTRTKLQFRHISSHQKTFLKLDLEVTVTSASVLHNSILLFSVGKQNLWARSPEAAAAWSIQLQRQEPLQPGYLQWWPTSSRYKRLTGYTLQPFHQASGPKHLKVFVWQNHREIYWLRAGHVALYTDIYQGVALLHTISDI